MRPSEAVGNPVVGLKIGEPVKVVYMRGTERKEAQLTPTARK